MISAMTRSRGISPPESLKWWALVRQTQSFLPLHFVAEPHLIVTYLTLIDT